MFSLRSDNVRKTAIYLKGPTETVTTLIYVLTIENYVIDGTPVRAYLLGEKLRFRKIDYGGLLLY